MYYIEYYNIYIPGCFSEGLSTFILQWGLVDRMLDNNALSLTGCSGGGGRRRLVAVWPVRLRSAVVDSERRGVVLVD